MGKSDSELNQRLIEIAQTISELFAPCPSTNVPDTHASHDNARHVIYNTTENARQDPAARPSDASDLLVASK